MINIIKKKKIYSKNMLLNKQKRRYLQLKYLLHMMMYILVTSSTLYIGLIYLWKVWRLEDTEYCIYQGEYGEQNQKKPKFVLKELSLCHKLQFSNP